MISSLSNMLSSAKKLHTLVLREKRHLKPVLYISTIMACCLVVWDPSILDPLVFTFLESPAEQDPKVFIPIVTETPLAKLFDLPFIPRDHKCEELFEKSGFNFTYSSHYWEHADAYKEFLIEMKMIHDGNTDEQTWVYHELAKIPTIKTICDVGFSTGHNAFYCLAGRFDVVLHSFEERVYNYTKDMEIFMASEFPFQFLSHFGDLKEEIPKFFTEFNTTKCDLTLLDSTLSAPKIQYLMEYFRKVANPEQNIVILDAHPSRSKRSSIKVWEAAHAQGILVENFRCAFTSDQDDSLRRPNVTGFLLGHFTKQ